MMIKSTHLAPLTSLRFFAAALVAIGHMGLFPAFSFLHQEVFGLSQGVTFFFVLSGFILAHAYAGKNTSFRSFFINRIARIWPLHIATLIVTLLLMDFGFLPTPDWTWSELMLNTVLLQSWIPLPNYYFSFNAVSWSISTELAFYMAFPLIIASSQRSFWGTTITSAALLGAMLMLATMMTSTTQGLIGAHPLTRVFEFTVGVLTYRIFSKHDFKSDTLHEVFALALCLGCMAVATSLNSNSPLMFWLSSAGPCIPMAFLIFIIAKGEGLISRMLSSQPMVFFGEASFALYMIHLIILRVVVANGWTTGVLAIDAVVIALSTLGLAALTFRFVETPSRKWMRGLSVAHPVSLRPRTNS